MNPKLYPKKHLGQNFLTDANILQKIINHTDITKNDTVTEIGPGMGALTQKILPKAKKTIVIEKDPRMVGHLKASFPENALKIIQADVLKYDFAQLPGKSILIGNLPYNISTPIIQKVLAHKKQFHAFYMTVQWEFGRRLLAQANSKDYGSLSCFVQFHCQGKILFKISPKAFSPQPKVQSCFMCLDLSAKQPYQFSKPSFLFSLIQTAFSQRRKKMVNALGDKFKKGRVEQILEQLNIDPRLRAENISLDQFILIAKKIL